MKSVPAFVCAGFLLGCASEPSSKVATSAEPLCAGSDVLRLQFVVLADPSHAGTSAMLFRNGSAFLRVDGRCRYWAYGFGAPDSNGSRVTTPLDAIVSGKLSEVEAENLARDLQYEAWSKYDGIHSEITTAGLTASVFTDGEHEFSCGRVCDAPGMPDAAKDLREVAYGWGIRLTDAGEGTTGPVRVVSYDTTTPQEEWEGFGYSCSPLSLPLPPSSYAMGTEGASFGVLVTADTDGLRGFRDDYRASRFRTPRPEDVPPWSVNVAIPVCESANVWSVVVGDVIEPYEIDGVVPHPM